MLQSTKRKAADLNEPVKHVGHAGVIHRIDDGIEVGHAVKPEQFAQALIPIRIRRDKERNDTIQKIVSQLGGNDEVPESFAEAVRKAAGEIRAEEQRQLTEYVLRRKSSKRDRE